MAKKIITLILAITLTLSATACSGKDDTNISVDDSGTQAGEEFEGSEQEAEDSGEENAGEEPEEQGSIDGAEENADPAGNEDVLAAAQEKMESVTNLEAQMIMEMDLQLAEDGGGSYSMETVTTLDMVCFKDPQKIKITMEMSMPVIGSTEQSIYAEVGEDGTTMMYMYDGTSWSRQVTETAAVAQYDAYNSMLSVLDNGQEYTFIGMDEVDGANAYKYSVTLSGEDAREAVLSSGGLDAVGLGMDAGQVEGILDGLEEIVEYVWIDEESLYPIKYEADMTAIMDALISGIFASMEEDTEGLSMNITKMKMSMTCFNFNHATDFTIPEEAKQD